MSSIVEKWARPGGEQAHLLYAEIARAARMPEFYLRFNVEDTLDGRFDTLTLMVVLVVRRLNNAGKEGTALAQEVIDMMFADMDLSLHEIGVSENKVGKKVKTMATAFLGRMKAYSSALDNGDSAELGAALSRNLYRDNGTDPLLNGLVEAVEGHARRLAALADRDLLAASPSLEFDIPDQISS
ncbi:ubiquinol-cytochrome C chaperone family protein [Alphaproteobacteria bacterium LSUCC0684]